MNSSNRSFVSSIVFSVLFLAVQYANAGWFSANSGTTDREENPYLLRTNELPKEIKNREDLAFVEWFLENHIPSCRKQHQSQQGLIKKKEREELVALKTAFELFFRACEQSEEECLYAAEYLNQKRDDLRILAVHASLIAQNHGPINRAEEEARKLLQEYKSSVEMAETSVDAEVNVLGASILEESLEKNKVADQEL